MTDSHVAYKRGGGGGIEWPVGMIKWNVSKDDGLRRMAFLTRQNEKALTSRKRLLTRLGRGIDRSDG